MRKVSLKTKINEKRGTGTCADYKPYIYVSESKSDGTASIITDWKHGRAIQCLSQSEAMAAMKAYLTEKGIGLDDIKSCLEYYPHYVKDRIFEVFSK